MITEKFQYHAPNNLQDALTLLKDNEEAKVLAGGHSLLPMMKLRFAEPQHLIDMNSIDSLKGIRQKKGTIYIGAMASENDLINSELLQQKCPLLPEAASFIADPQVRNRGTIGGDIAHGDPGNDHPSIMMVLDATFVLASLDGERLVNANDFFLGTYWTELQEHEILKEIQVKEFVKNAGYAYVKLKRKTGDFATAASAVFLTLKKGVCNNIRIALTNVGPMSLRVKEAEEFLTGKTINDDDIEQAIVKVMDICDPIEDLRGDVEYKTHMAGEMTRRSIKQALAKAKGG